MSGETVTPTRQQYLDVKAQYPDAVVFFRLGDFYETFDEDASIVARELDLVLTSRPQGKGTRIPMAGVPYHAAENYIARLIAKGYKIALCEQMGTELINGLMPREVIRVFTAGTVVEPGMLEAGRNNYLAAVVFEDGHAGLAYADITTGEFATTQLRGRNELLEELARLSPVELLVIEGGDFSHPAIKTISPLPAWRFELGHARQTLLRHFGVSTLDAFGCEQKPLATRAAGAALHYLQETQRGRVDQMQRLTTYATDGYMALSEATRRNLELTDSLTGAREGSLLYVLNKTITPMGARLLRQRLTRPLLRLGPLNERLDQVETLVNDGLLRAELRAALKGLPDLERLTNRLLGGRATPRDVGQMAVALAGVGRLKARLAGVAVLADAERRLDPCADVAETINRALPDEPPANLLKSGFIRPGFSAELDGVVNTSAHAREWVASLEPRERERSGIPSLKVGFNKVFGYYIEITHANTRLVPSDYIRKQTLTNAERYITPELKEYETLILNAEERILQIERRLFSELCQLVGGHGGRLLATAAALAELDVAAALAEVAALNDYTRPVLADDIALHVENGRHPVVEGALAEGLGPGMRRGERFVPNDTHFDDGNLIQIITGPNMSGKSTYLRQVALITLMAQIGSFVPAAAAHIGLVDRIFTRIGAHDELHAGRSTFMVEMVETAEILNHASHRSLLVLDEIGRGTSTYDGLSLAWAIVKFLHNHPRLKPRTLFATHYHELTGLAGFLPNVANFNVAVSEEGGEVTFLHHIVPGGADRSYGIHVAQLAGLPRDVILRANDILRDLERRAPTTAVEPSRLNSGQQIALFPDSSPFLDELKQLDVNALTPLQAINKLYEWKQRYAGHAVNHSIVNAVYAIDTDNKMKPERSKPVPDDNESEELRRTRRELERVKARLERLQQRKSSLLAMAAHDLRTPVAIIQGYSELLAGTLTVETDPAIREYLTTIVAHATVLRHGIENLVALDQMERGEVQLTAVRCDLNELVAQALAQVEGLIAVKGLAVTVATPPESIWIMADEEQIGRALYSLFGHAEKYARENGQLFFTVAAVNGLGQVTVRDPNRVLPEQMVGRAFDLVEIGRDGRAALRGTDLGLVVARRVAEAHSGRAEVESDAGQGTTFALYLPVAAEE